MSTKKPLTKFSKAKAAKSVDSKKPKLFKKKAKSEDSDLEVLTPEIVDPSLDNLVDEAPSGGLTVADPVARYMAELKKYPLLTREKEHELAVKYKETGDPKIAEILVTSNLRFVVKVAAEYSKFGARLIDLIQEGNVGLMHAVKEFNPYKGVRLITYAVWWIRGYIQDHLMRQFSMVRVGTTQNQRKLFYQLQRHKDELEKLGFNQAVAQLSGRLDIPEDEVKEMAERVMGRDISLDQPVGEGEGTRILDFQTKTGADDIEDALSAHENLSRLTENLEHIRPTLNERELYLLENRILADEPQTLQDIGDKYGITREAVRQMETRLIDKLRKEFFS